MAVLSFLFAVSLLLSASALTEATTDVRYCDKKGDYDVKVSGVAISPDPIAKGKPATFNISASAGKAISGGQLVIDVSYFGFHVYTETDDICGKTSCPISSGDDFMISHSQVLPGYTPPGSYTLKMTMMEDGSNQQLTCITFDFSIGFWPLEVVAYN